MKINFEEIFTIQKKLDNTIYQNSGVTYAQVKEKVKLALIVEIAEMANEIRCFKYWSKKQPSERSVILEEYVDGIHFFSTIAYNRNISPIMNVSLVNKTDDKEELTHKINQIIGQSKWMKFNFKKMFREYIQLGMMLGYSFDEIKTAYLAKNKINFQRQETNY